VTNDSSYLTGAGGLRIFWQSWRPDCAPRAVVLLAHGASEHSGRYAHVAARLVDEGYVVYAIEHRGHGRSQGPRALIDRMSNAVADLGALIELAAEQHDGLQLFLIGHSMGGTVALEYAIEHGNRLSGLILTGPLAALEAAPAAQRLIARVLSTLTPGLGVVAIDANLISRDPAVVTAYVEDPLVYHGRLPARTITELADAIGSFPDGAQSITVPTLVMYGTDDQLCPVAGSQMLEQRLGAADKTVIPYEGLYHEILNEPEQDRVLDDLCSWLAVRVGVPA
jgi:acylglycerol lipase